MKKIMIIIFIITLFLSVLSVFATDFVPCINEPGHFLDNFGNGYCSMEKETFYNYMIQNQICSSNYIGVGEK